MSVADGKTGLARTGLQGKMPGRSRVGDVVMRKAKQAPVSTKVHCWSGVPQT